jgi:peptidyl-prolyl cis-trans isomerase A (cyclophilin A)
MRRTRSWLLALALGAPALALGCHAGDTPDVGAPGSAAQAAEAPKPVAKKPDAKGKPVVVIKTSKGDIRVELESEKAPITVKNFLAYVDAGFYDGTIFHRVIDGFMIQGGGFTKDMAQKPTNAPIKNEADNGLKNARGTIAMARTNVVDSATAQFFINLVDNSMLNHGARDFVYAVFGRVTQGQDVVDAIAKVRTGQKGPYGDVPTEPIVIESIKRAQ